MPKFTEASEEIKKIVLEVSNELGFAQYGLDFEALCVHKAKEPVTISKASAVAEYLSKRDDLILVICYEDAFDLVDDQNKYMWIRMAMDKISIDTEKDKVSLDCPMISIPEGFYEKYGAPAMDSARLGIHTIAKIEQDKKEEAERKKALKASKKKNGNA